jgi:hypothetical protein
MKAATVIIEGRTVEVWVLGLDADVRATLWVFEQDDPDVDYLIGREQVVQFYDKQR